ncbi:MAG: LacI family DNA-binding transcriptional regulator [Pseudomonadota bacterium]
MDVARHAGVSFKTVSRVLNNESNVRERTRNAVMASVAKLGYQPNRLARTLRTQEPQFIALLFHNPSIGYVTDIQLGALERCRHDGCHLIVEDCTDYERSVKTLISEPHLLGALLTPPLSDDTRILDMLDAYRINYVRIAPHIEPDRASSVSMDDEQAAFEITHHLLSIGHRRIGFIQGPDNHGVSKLRLDGYLRALATKKIKRDNTLIMHGDFSYQSGLEQAESLLSIDPHPTAIFASNDDMAAASLAVAYKRGLTVPDALSVVGFDDTQIAQAICPQLTTIRQPTARMAERSVDLLLEASTPEPGKPQHVQLAHEMIVRQSSAPPPTETH